MDSRAKKAYFMVFDKKPWFCEELFEDFMDMVRAVSLDSVK